VRNLGRDRPHLVALVVVLGAGVAVIAAALGVRAVHGLRCLAEGRDGWTVELPEGIATLEQLRQEVEEQTHCVPVNVGYVDWGLVPDGRLAVPVTGPRTWAPFGGEIKVWVEGTAAQASDPCAPLGPRAAPPSVASLIDDPPPA
jgi:hypothetical protein